MWTAVNSILGGLAIVGSFLLLVVGLAVVIGYFVAPETSEYQDEEIDDEYLWRTKR